MNVRSLLLAGTLSISLTTVVLGSRDPQMSEHRPSRPDPAPPCPSLSLSAPLCPALQSACNVPNSFQQWLWTLVSIPPQIFFSTCSIFFFLECARIPTSQEIQLFGKHVSIARHSALAAAAGAGDTRMDKEKPVPLRRWKPGASSDNSAYVSERRGSHRSRERRQKLRNQLPFSAGGDKVQCAQASVFTISFYPPATRWSIHSPHFMSNDMQKGLSFC